MPSPSQSSASSRGSRGARARSFAVVMLAALEVALMTGVGGAAARAPLVEHRVGREEAQRAARRMAHADEYYLGLSGAAPAPAAQGCQQCTRAELRYCSGPDVMHDHCCCDMRYHEAFPFVPHTCYLRETPCAPLAADCQDYERLRACCCDDLLRQRWSSAVPAASAASGAWLAVAAALTHLLR